VRSALFRMQHTIRIQTSNLKIVAEANAVGAGDGVLVPAAGVGKRPLPPIARTARICGEYQT
jgi:hypothetical protein